MLAIVFATTGVYSVIAYAVAERTGEIGVRVALGATATQVIRTLLVDGIRLVLPGIVLGTASAGARARLIRSLLFETAPADPLTLWAVSFLMLSIGPCACYVPARRAARVDPMIALRTE